MYIDDFEDFYREDESEFPEGFYSRNNVEYDESLDSFEEFAPFTCPMGCPFYRQFYRQMPPPEYGGYRQMDRPPSGPPPSTTPVEPFSAAGGPETFVDAGSIRGCLFRYVYIWPRRGSGFWMWLTFIGSRSISGWRWDGRRWFRFGMDLRDVRSFRC